MKLFFGNQPVGLPAGFASYATFMMTVILMVIVTAACGMESAGPDSTPPLTTLTSTIPLTGTPQPSGTATLTGAVPAQLQAVEEMVQAAASRTPLPTATKDLIEQNIETLIKQTKLSDSSFLGLSSELWINILVSAVLLVIGYLLLANLLIKLLDWLVRHTRTEFDDQFISTIRRELKWLAVIFIGRLAIFRLDLWSDPQILFLDDIFFFLYLSVLSIIALRLFRFTGDWILKYRIPETGRERLAPLVLLFKRLGYLIVILVAVSVTLDQLGFNISWIAGFILLIGIIIAIGLREVLDDLTSGILILMDPPYRVGDDVFIQEINTWGRVVEIGLRNSQLRSLDDRTIIIPNGQMGKSQIINFSYPTPIYRIHTDISLTYESDMVLVRRVVEEAVRGVEGVVLHKPVNVYFLEFTEAGRAIRVIWWINSVNDKLRMLDRVNSALEEALVAADITVAYTTYNVKLLESGQQERSVHQQVGRQNGGQE
jgi:MscS family membrane protein